MNFPQYLKSKGFDDATISSEERAVVMKMFLSEPAAEVPLPPIKDGSGNVLQFGDKVVMEFTIGGIHPRIDQATGNFSQDLGSVNLDFQGRHFISVLSNQVKKI